MTNFTVNQWAIIVLVLILGWLLGLLSTNSARWRRRYDDERRAHEATVRDHEEALRDRQARLDAANDRIVEYERARPVAVAPVSAPIGAGTAGAVATPVRGAHDDLTAIRGIDADRAVRLQDAGLHSFRDIAAMTATDEAALEGRLGLPSRTIAHERWREQAELLDRGRLDEHRRVYP